MISVNGATLGCKLLDFETVFIFLQIEAIIPFLSTSLCRVSPILHFCTPAPTLTVCKSVSGNKCTMLQCAKLQGGFEGILGMVVEHQELCASQSSWSEKSSRNNR